MVGHHAQVQHVRVGDDEAGPPPYRRPLRPRRVAVESVEFVGLEDGRGKKMLDLGELVLGQSFGREKVNSTGTGVFQRGLHDREVITHAFTARA